MDEQKNIEFMIKLYCKKNHKVNFCADCEELFEYCKLKMEKCPRKKVKTFCASCPIHCYQNDYREKIKQVMRFSGPRMLIYNPKMAFLHIKDTIKHKRNTRRKNEKNNVNKRRND